MAKKIAGEFLHLWEDALINLRAIVLMIGWVLRVQSKMGLSGRAKVLGNGSGNCEGGGGGQSANNHCLESAAQSFSSRKSTFDVAKN